MVLLHSILKVVGKSEEKMEERVGELDDKMKSMDMKMEPSNL